MMVNRTPPAYPESPNHHQSIMAAIGDFIISILRETAFLYNEMAIYLLLGFAAGGVIHAFFPQDRVRRSIGRRGFLSSLKASLLGVPLPLCSCSVIPTSLALHRSGASTGATVSFLISTPQTGVDSIAVTYSLLGPVYAVFRPLVAFVTGTAGGVLADLRDGTPIREKEEGAGGTRPATLAGKLALAYEYGFHRLIRELARWLVLGIFLGGAITALVPDHFLEMSGGNMVLSYVGALLFSVPLYVCATGTTPVAAALILKGLSPGAAFVLLMAGPATNAAGITMLWKSIGRRATLIYLGVIVAGSVSGGVVFDLFLRPAFREYLAGWHEDAGPLTLTLKLAGSAVLLFYLLLALLPPRRRPSPTDGGDADGRSYRVAGMTCDACRRRVEEAVRSVSGVTRVTADPDGGLLTVDGSYDQAQLLAAVEKAGYPATCLTGRE